MSGVPLSVVFHGRRRVPCQVSRLASCSMAGVRLASSAQDGCGVTSPRCEATQQTCRPPARSHSRRRAKSRSFAALRRPLTRSGGRQGRRAQNLPHEPCLTVSPAAAAYSPCSILSSQVCRKSALAPSVCAMLRLRMVPTAAQCPALKSPSPPCICRCCS
eukprot:352726-Chlamydomonas_euryale.AAC.7